MNVGAKTSSSRLRGYLSIRLDHSINPILYHIPKLPKKLSLVTVHLKKIIFCFNYLATVAQVVGLSCNPWVGGWYPCSVRLSSCVLGQETLLTLSGGGQRASGADCMAALLLAVCLRAAVDTNVVNHHQHLNAFVKG